MGTEQENLKNMVSVKKQGVERDILTLIRVHIHIYVRTHTHTHTHIYEQSVYIHT